jgi:hypothetical protein
VKGLGTLYFVTQAASTLRNIGMRTRIAIGVVAVILLGLLLWLAFAILSWLWVQATTLGETGMQLLGDAVTQVEQLKPGLLAEAERGLAGAREQVGQWAPGLAEALPTIDVSGSDIGPVARFPGLIRSHYASEGGLVEVRYAGLARLPEVVQHYVGGFVAAGFTHEVLSAAVDGERHRFSRGEEAFHLTVTPGPAGLIELRLQEQAPGVAAPTPVPAPAVPAMGT